MKKYTRILWLLLALPLLFACGAGDGNGDGTETGVTPEFTMTAKITAIGERIEVTVIEAPHGNTGPFWVITGEATAYRGKNGEAIAREALSVGDTVEITYGGQVMMSYPPQIVALLITQK